MAIFNRQIDIEIDDEGSDLCIRGSLRDSRFGDNLHGIDVEMTVSVFDGEIKEISGSMPHRPIEECAEGLASLDELKGVRIKPGFTDLVKQTVGSNRGCTHLSSLVMNMGNASVQGRGAYVRKHFPDDNITDSSAMRDGVRELGLVDSCVCWREDGPVYRRWLASMQEAQGEFEAPAQNEE